MPLSRPDIERIQKLGYRLTDFAQKTEDEMLLKNKLGKCVFLSDCGCRIYPHRPEGCRLYPLVYDENSQKATVDYLCPYGYEFEVKEEDAKRLKALLGRLGIRTQ
jgi:hypothetical protein